MKGRHLASPLALTAALLCAAALVQAAVSPTTYGLQATDVLFNGVTYLSGVKRASYTGRAWQSTSQSAGGVPVKSYANAYYPPAEFEVGVSGLLALAQKLTEFSAGRPVRLSTQVRTTSLAADVPDWTSLGDCDLAYFEFPTLDAGAKSPGLFKLRFVPTAFTPMADKLAGTGAPMAPTAAVFTQNNFTVSIPGLDCSHVTSVDGITIESSLNTRSSLDRVELAPTMPASGVANWNFRIEARGVTARGLREWMLANQNGGPTKREITIQLLAPSLSTTLLTLHGIGVGLLSLRPLPDTNEGVRRSQAELFVERWEIMPPGATAAPRTKLELAVPGAGIPLGRK